MLLFKHLLFLGFMKSFEVSRENIFLCFTLLTMFIYFKEFFIFFQDFLSLLM